MADYLEELEAIDLEQAEALAAIVAGFNERRRQARLREQERIVEEQRLRNEAAVGLPFLEAVAERQPRFLELKKSVLDLIALHDGEDLAILIKASPDHPHMIEQARSVGFADSDAGLCQLGVTAINLPGLALNEKSAYSHNGRRVLIVFQCATRPLAELQACVPPTFRQVFL